LSDGIYNSIQVTVLATPSLDSLSHEPCLALGIYMMSPHR
jgi:hypothetical protein